MIYTCRIISKYAYVYYRYINQRFIVWKLNNTNVDWKNTATVLNCVSARWQDEEDRPPISIFWASPCFAGDSESYNPLWNLERSTGHVPHTIANIYYPELSGYFKESKPSSESVLWYAKKAPVYEYVNTNPCGTTGENNQNMSSRKMWGPTCPVFILPYPANDVSKTVTILLSHIIQYKCIYNNYKL